MVGKSPQSYLENACDSATVLNASVVSGWTWLAARDDFCNWLVTAASRCLCSSPFAF